jgi:hypothetical protein
MIDGGGRIKETTMSVRHNSRSTLFDGARCCRRRGQSATADNVFEKCKTFVQEADPWEWLSALKRIEALDVKTIVPGHGEPCGKSYLKRQAEIIENWIGLVEALSSGG